MSKAHDSRNWLQHPRKGLIIAHMSIYGNNHCLTPIYWLPGKALSFIRNLDEIALEFVRTTSPPAVVVVSGLIIAHMSVYGNNH